MKTLISELSCLTLAKWSSLKDKTMLVEIRMFLLNNCWMMHDDSFYLDVLLFKEMLRF